MDLRNLLMQPNKKNQRRKFKSVATSAVFHLVAVGLILLSSMSAARQVDAEDKPITAYLASAPPPPPPPPPPPAAKTASTPQQPKVTPVTPVEVPQPTFVQPREIPKELPKVDLTAIQRIPVSEPSVSLPDVPVGAGVEGGVPGGVVGGVEGGVMGGVIGGEIGGVEGGVVGGVVGGTVGGVEGGTGTEPAPVAPPPAPAGPLRVGGAVKAPTVLSRPDPVYTEVARKGRVTGVVIVEATIDKSGNVDRVRVIRGLPMGLSESAVNAVKRWKFKPGHMNGRPVDVLFNLTVNFQLGADSPTVTQSKPVRSAPAASTPAPVAPEPAAPEPAPEPQAPADSPDTASVGGDGSA